MAFPLWFAWNDDRSAGKSPYAPELEPVTNHPAPPATWVVRLAADDEDALGELMAAYFDDIAELAFRYVHTYDVARDIAQETFIRCWHQRHTLRPDTELIHYLRRTARNRALDTLRHEARAEKWETRASDALRMVAPHVENAGIASVDADQFDTIVQQVATRLTPRVREIFLLYYQHGLEPNEIAGLLLVAPSTIYNQLRKAMQAFTGALARWRD